MAVLLWGAAWLVLLLAYGVAIVAIARGRVLVPGQSRHVARPQLWGWAWLVLAFAATVSVLHFSVGLNMPFPVSWSLAVGSLIASGVSIFARRPRRGVRPPTPPV